MLSASKSSPVSLQPGDRLPSIRELTAEWGCTPGTVQRAYHELAIQELVVSRAGQGTHVVQQLPRERDDTPLRRASLVHRAQAFLLEVLTAGYTTGEVETALQLALDQWRVLSEQPSTGDPGQAAFCGQPRPGAGLDRGSFRGNRPAIFLRATVFRQPGRLDRPGRRQSRPGRQPPVG